MNIHKTAILNRAVPGSGKTSMTRCIVSFLESHGIACRVHSTDDYFMVDGRYVFDVSRLYEYHIRNLEAFKGSLAAAIPIVICDNTNIHPWETEPYTDAARAMGYRILFLDFPPRPLAQHRESQIVSDRKPDAHEVPDDSLVEFIRDFHVYDSLLDPDMPVDPVLHRRFEWSDAAQNAVDSGIPAKHFDADAVRMVHPEMFSEEKVRVPALVFDFVTKK